jgi:hypothetical protein
VRRPRTVSRKPSTTRQRKTENQKRKTASNAARRATSSVAHLQELLECQARELEDAREERAAISEVLRVISSSPGYLQPVFQAMLENAIRLCQAKFGAMFLYDGETFRTAALHGVSPAYAEAFASGRAAWEVCIRGSALKLSRARSAGPGSCFVETALRKSIVAGSRATGSHVRDVEPRLLEYRPLRRNFAALANEWRPRPNVTTFGGLGATSVTRDALPAGPGPSPDSLKCVWRGVRSSIRAATTIVPLLPQMFQGKIPFVFDVGPSPILEEYVVGGE